MRGGREGFFGREVMNSYTLQVGAESGYGGMRL